MLQLNTARKSSGRIKPRRPLHGPGQEGLGGTEGQRLCREWGISAFRAQAKRLLHLSPKHQVPFLAGKLRVLPHSSFNGHVVFAPIDPVRRTWRHDPNRVPCAFASIVAVSFEFFFPRSLQIKSSTSNGSTVQCRVAFSFLFFLFPCDRWAAYAQLILRSLACETTMVKHLVTVSVSVARAFHCIVWRALKAVFFQHAALRYSGLNYLSERFKLAQEKHRKC